MQYQYWKDNSVRIKSGRIIEDHTGWDLRMWASTRHIKEVASLREFS